MTAPDRWTVAKIYSDMWLDPGDDPRNTGRLSPDGELATLADGNRPTRTDSELARKRIPDRPRGGFASGRRDGHVTGHGLEPA